MHKFKNKKKFRKSSCKGWSAQQRFNIIIRKNKETNKQTYLFGVLLLRFLFQLSMIPVLIGRIMDIFSERKVKTWTKFSRVLLREWPSKTKQWINSGSKCYWLELRDGSGKVVGESIALCAARSRAGSAIETDICVSITQLDGIIFLLRTGVQWFPCRTRDVPLHEPLTWSFGQVG